MNRLTAMRVIAWIMTASAVGFGLFTIVFGFVGPGQEIHAVHNAFVASLLAVLSAPPAIVVARAPDRSIRPLVILGIVAIAGLVTMALSLTLDPFSCRSCSSSACCGRSYPAARGPFRPADQTGSC